MLVVRILSFCPAVRAFTRSRQAERMSIAEEAAVDV